MDPIRADRSLLDKVQEIMDRDTANSSWQELSGRIKRRWNQLSDEELAQAEGDREYLLRKVHERYGLARDEIDQELDLLGVSEAPRREATQRRENPEPQDALKNRGTATQSGRAAPLDQPRHTGRERRRGGERPS